MLPGLALLAGTAVSGLCWRGQQKIARVELQNWPVWVYAVAGRDHHSDLRQHLVRQTPKHRLRAPLISADPFPEAEEVARFIRANSPPSAPMAVLGSEPELYFLSRRHSVTGYIYTYGMMEPQPFARRMQER